MIPRQQRLKRSFCGLGADPDTIRLPEGEIAFPYGAGRRSYGAGAAFPNSCPPKFSERKFRRVNGGISSPILNLLRGSDYL